MMNSNISLANSNTNSNSNPHPQPHPNPASVATMLSSSGPQALEVSLQEKARQTLHFLSSYFLHSRFETRAELLDSIRYSLLQPGAKRFRPCLAMMTAEALGYSSERVLPYAAALECVHTYSLIHDDLPAMDNSDWRRGHLTNHKVYGDAMAILAGDALLTEAFQIIASHYEAEPMACIRAIQELANGSGLSGMVGGQAIDLHAQQSQQHQQTQQFQQSQLSFENVQHMHRLKTGALIRAAAIGAAYLCFATEERIAQIRAYSTALGLAFQVTDDILDHNPEKPEPGSYPALIGLQESKMHLMDLTDRCLAAIESWGAKAEPLRDLARYNRHRLF